MHRIHNLTIIGTSHIAKQSVNEIKRYIIDNNPNIVAVELDRNRLSALLQKKKQQHISFKQIRHIGFKGFMFAVIGGWIQKKMGKIVQIQPGEDMLTAVKMAKEHNAKIALIDQNISITLQKLSKAFTIKEMWKLFVDMLKGVFFKKREMKKYGMEKLDLTKVPGKKVIKQIMRVLKKRYPNIHRVLVHERNVIMARNLSKIMQQNPDKHILAVVGAGHEDEMFKMIQENNKISYSLTVENFK